jgi:hypothetical protein
MPRTCQRFEWKKYNSVGWIAKIESKKLKRVVTGTSGYAGNFDRKAMQVIARKNKGIYIS